MKRLLFLMALAAVAMIVTDAEAFRITTNDAGGADCELRESAPTQNRGTNTELASRVASNRASVMYMKWGVQDITTADLAGDITVRTTYRHENLVASRFEDLVGGGDNTGLDYYVLDPTVAGADWDELTIAPTTDAGAGTVQAPGYSYDGDYTTKGCGSPIAPTAGLYYLGRSLFDSDDLVWDGKLPIGGAHDLTLGTGSILHQAIELAQTTGHQTLTVVAVIAHDWDNPNTNWIGFNYIMNPKEQDPLREQLASPWGGASVAFAGDIFAPQLTNEAHPIPEPATLALLGLGGLLLRRKR